jgi:RHS repeat-associated protein
MKKNGVLTYLLTDQLGSTSLAVDASGTKISEMRYKPWGEVRYAWTAVGGLPTDYTYTGQKSYMDDPTTTTTTEGFGLMYYNARWYDSALGRFISPDSIVPSSTQGVQAYDRYAYVSNNPIRYSDPSGHRVTECGGGQDRSECRGTTQRESEQNAEKAAYWRQRNDALKCNGGNASYCSGYNMTDQDWKKLGNDMADTGRGLWNDLLLSFSGAPTAGDFIDVVAQARGLGPYGNIVDVFALVLNQVAQIAPIASGPAINTNFKTPIPIATSTLMPTPSPFSTPTLVTPQAQLPSQAALTSTYTATITPSQTFVPTKTLIQTLMTTPTSPFITITPGSIP